MRITSIRMASLYWSPATKRAMGQSTNPGSEHQSREECLHILHSVCNESFIKKWQNIVSGGHCSQRKEPKKSHPNQNVQTQGDERNCHILHKVKYRGRFGSSCLGELLRNVKKCINKSVEMEAGVTREGLD